jgi:hypothetical protein
MPQEVREQQVKETTAVLLHLAKTPVVAAVQVLREITLRLPQQALEAREYSRPLLVLQRFMLVVAAEGGATQAQTHPAQVVQVVVATAARMPKVSLARTGLVVVLAVRQVVP